MPFVLRVKEALENAKLLQKKEGFLQNKDTFLSP